MPKTLGHLAKCLRAAVSEIDRSRDVDMSQADDVRRNALESIEQVATELEQLEASAGVARCSQADNKGKCTKAATTVFTQRRYWRGSPRTVKITRCDEHPLREFLSREAIGA
jgi:hypothetical protein